MPEHPLLLAPWAALWVLGGWWLTLAAFRLDEHERPAVALVVGLVIEGALADLLCLARLPVAAAAWLAAGLVFAGGAAARFAPRGRVDFRPRSIAWGQAVALAGLGWLFLQVGRGLAIFDDFAHLPTLSLMAAGQIPPHFPLDPSIPYGYHYFLMLIAAQWMRLGGLSSWLALDMARALGAALGALLAGLWALRLTRSRLAGFLGGGFFLLAGGARWLLLLLPAPVLNWVSGQVTLIGSGASSGATLAQALTAPWAVEGAGPLPFPFALVNGMVNPGVMNALSINSLLYPAAVIALLLGAGRWRGKVLPGALSGLLIAATFLMVETTPVLFAAGGALAAALAWMKWRKAGWAGGGRWLIVLAGGSLLGAALGGAWTDILLGKLAGLLGRAAASYQTIEFSLTAWPALISTHLGELALFNPAQAVALAAELGPVVLALPLALAWGWKALRAGRWLEAGWIGGSAALLGLVFVRFSGSTGVRNTTRLYEWLVVCQVYAFPLGWVWLRRRGAAWRVAAAGLAALACLNGAALLGVQLPAAQRPVYSSFITALDARVNAAWWDQLPADALVFDPLPNRAPAVLGRPTDAATTWYAMKPEWVALTKAPETAALRAAGFTHVYVGRAEWNRLTPEQEAGLRAACAVELAREEDSAGDFRVLIDISGCGSK